MSGEFICINLVKTTVVQHQRSLLRRSNPNPPSNEAALISLFWAPNRQRIGAGNEFRCFLLPDWQINNGIFNRRAMALTQALVHRLGPRARFWCCFAVGRKQKFGSAVYGEG